jgi:hypothetical protein
VRESVRLPQVLAARETGRLAELIATPAMDAYSLGLVLSMVLSRSCAPPFPDDAAAVEAATTRAPWTAGLHGCTDSSSANEAIRQLLAIEPGSRCSIEVLLESNMYLNPGRRTPPIEHHRAVRV